MENLRPGPFARQNCAESVSWVKVAVVVDVELKREKEEAEKPVLLLGSPEDSGHSPNTYLIAILLSLDYGILQVKVSLVPIYFTVTLLAKGIMIISAFRTWNCFPLALIPRLSPSLTSVALLPLPQQSNY